MLGVIDRNNECVTSGMSLYQPSFHKGLWGGLSRSMFRDMYIEVLPHEWIGNNTLFKSNLRAMCLVVRKKLMHQFIIHHAMLNCQRCQSIPKAFSRGVPWKKTTSMLKLLCRSFLDMPITTQINAKWKIEHKLALFAKSCRSQSN